MFGEYATMYKEVSTHDHDNNNAVRQCGAVVLRRRRWQIARHIRRELV